MNLRTFADQHSASATAVGAVTVVLAVVIGSLLGSAGLLSGLLGIALVLMVTGAAAVLLHPRAVYCALAFVLGALPMALLPGFGLPIVQVLALAVWVAVLTHRFGETRTYGIEIAVGVLVLTSVISILMTATGPRDLLEFVKWVMATSMVFALLRLSRDDLRVFGRTFVFGAWLGAILALAILAADKATTILNSLSAIGYGRVGLAGTHLRIFALDDNVVVRVTGTYIDPNAAGIFMLVATALAVTLLRGWQRLVVTPVLLVALVASLSRAAIFSLLMAIILLLIFQRMSTGRRMSFVVGTVIVAMSALLVPPIYERFANSFSENDRGSADRRAALEQFTHSMADGWWFGHGWGRPEFIDELVGYNTNYVANSPLLTVYRGGIFTGIAFVAVLIAGAVLAYRQARQQPWESGVIGAIFVGFALVGLQLDFPVVTISPLTMVWSVLIVFLAANPVIAGPDDEEVGTQMPEDDGVANRGVPTGGVPNKGGAPKVRATAPTAVAGEGAANV